MLLDEGNSQRPLSARRDSRHQQSAFSLVLVISNELFFIFSSFFPLFCDFLLDARGMRAYLLFKLHCELGCIADSFVGKSVCFYGDLIIFYYFLL